MKKLIVIPLLFAVLFGTTACGKKISKGSAEIEEKGASVSAEEETSAVCEKEETTKAKESGEVTDKETLEELSSVLANRGKEPEQRSESGLPGGFFRTEHTRPESRFGEIDINNAKVYQRDGCYYIVENLEDGRVRITQITYDSNGYEIRSGIYDGDTGVDGITGKK